MIRFYIPNQKPGERIILLVRRHVFILLIKFFFWAALGAVPYFLYLILRGAKTYILPQDILFALIVILLSIFYLTIWLLMLHAFVDYYLDVWIVTNMRVLNIEQRNLFSRVVSEHELVKIQDVTSEVRGILPTFLNYGEVYIQTAGETQRFVFRQVPDPLAIKRTITALCEKGKIPNNQ